MNRRQAVAAILTPLATSALPWWPAEPPDDSAAPDDVPRTPAEVATFLARIEHESNVREFGRVFDAFHYCSAISWSDAWCAAYGVGRLCETSVDMILAGMRLADLGRHALAAHLHASGRTWCIVADGPVDDRVRRAMRRLTPDWWQCVESCDPMALQTMLRASGRLA